MKYIALFLTLFVATESFARNITIGWDANSETDLAGYRVYKTTTPGQYTFGAANAFATVAKGVTTLATTVSDTVDSYFVVTAYDTSGNESLRSNEINTLPPSVPANLRITINATTP